MPMAENGGQETRPRSPRKRPSEPAGRDTYHVLDPKGLELLATGSGPRACLNMGQKCAEKYSEPVVLTVERRSLFGPSTPLYRVVRDEHGNVTSFEIDAQD